MGWGPRSLSGSNDRVWSPVDLSLRGMSPGYFFLPGAPPHICVWSAWIPSGAPTLLLLSHHYHTMIPADDFKIWGKNKFGVVFFFWYFLICWGFKECSSRHNCGYLITISLPAKSNQCSMSWEVTSWIHPNDSTPLSKGLISNTEQKCPRPTGWLAL